MKRCEYCKSVITEIYGSGRFCSMVCARGFSTSKNRDEINSKVSHSMKCRKVTTIEKDCEYCSNLFTSPIRKHRRFCSKRCGALNRGKHIEGYERYKKDCQFNFSLNEYPSEFDFNLVKNYGWYSAKNHGNNMNGVSRDHIVSIRWGFKNNVDVKYMKHPANCQLLRHNDNVSKGKKQSISLQELKSKIEDWDRKYLGSKH